MLFEYQNSLVLFFYLDVLMILEFLQTAVNLKKIPRQGWIDKLEMKSPESVADHTYSLAMLGMVISDLGDFDSEKVIKMALLHDLAESKIGDFTPDQINKSEKEKIENLAFRLRFSPRKWIFKSSFCKNDFPNLFFQVKIVTLCPFCDNPFARGQRKPCLAVR